MRQTKKLYSAHAPVYGFIDILCEKPIFRREIEGLRRKWKINVANEIQFMNENYEITDQYKLTGNVDFISDLKKLQKKFNLGEEWFSFMEEYIFIDSFTYDKRRNFFIEKRTGDEGDAITGKPAYYLRIFSGITQEDLVESFDEINEFINGKKTSREKTWKTFERDHAIFLLAKQGWCIEDIAHFIKYEHKTEIDYLAIKTAEARYRKNMGITETNNLKYRDDKRKKIKLVTNKSKLIC